jgi:5-methylcytosine-specific restriction enzyme A
MALRIPRPCSYPGCSTLGCTVHVRPVSTEQRPPDRRPSAARRGYDARWRERRKEFLSTHPYCEDCGAPATIPDHVPSRRTLLAQGVADPDADQYLHPRCHSCHNKHTNAVDGGGWHGRGD